MDNTSKQIKVDFGNLILLIRGQQVVLDSDLASIFGVETKVLLQAFKRNAKRFPGEFAFQLTNKEFFGLRSQIVTSKGRGGRRYSPYVFTEHGVVMMANLLNSKVAIDASILIVKTFIRLRKLTFNFTEISMKIKKLEEKDFIQDDELKLIIDTLNKLMKPIESSNGNIGFQTDE